MSIQTVQLNTPNLTDSIQKRTVESYRAANKPVSTEQMVKPLPPQGHLVDDNFATSVKYFFKDIGYDMKSLKNGYTGVANDHQLGRLNDVGLRLGGVCIATYLASQTTNPRARLMEYIGLAVFLTSMAVYPKIAINTPARILHGYDIDKEYIDDQGRKKSVHQDSNYIPYDMYDGKYKGEDLDAIGDRMGIPRDIKNRHDLIREQMRKVATQNNTMWMLTAGFATPLMTALLCSGIEKFIVSPALEKARNKTANSEISSMIKKVLSEKPDYNTINNTLGDNIKRIVTKYEGKTLPSDVAENIKEILRRETDCILSEGINLDTDKMLAGESVVRIDEKSLKATFEQAKKSMSGRQLNFISGNILPSESEVISMIKEIKPEADLKKGIEFSSNEFEILQKKIINYADSKIANVSGEASKHKDYLKSNVLKFQNSFEFPKMNVLTKEASSRLIKYANILGDFKKNIAIMDKCENFKFEYVPESVLANYYEKFQKTLVKQLGISPKDFKRISNDKDYAQKILNAKFEELSKDETKYKQTFEKLGKILSDMEAALHGNGENESQIKDLINAIETIYHNTANALKECGIGENTASRLVNGETPNIINSKQELYNLLDGINHLSVKGQDANSIETLKFFANGKGSSKNLRISRLLNRYQGENNSFFRILHTLDFYKSALNPDKLIKRVSYCDENYVQTLVAKVKEALLKGSISDFILKSGIENISEYKDFYNLGWALENKAVGDISQKGILTEQTQEVLNKYKGSNLAERLQTYITRFKNIMSNDTTDFTKPAHVLDVNSPRMYTDMAKNNEAKFNLVAQSPLDMLQKATAKMHGDRMWLRSVGIMTCIVFGITLASQFLFGKIKNKNNLQKINHSDINQEKEAYVTSK